MNIKRMRYLSEIIDTKEWEKEFAPFDLVEMIAGVGAGKNHWVCELAKQQNNSVLFVTSRRITADMQSKKMNASRTIDWDKFKRHALGGKPMKGGKLLVSCTNARLASFIRNDYDAKKPITFLWEYFNYIIIDEAHSLVTDSSFADSSFYVWKFIEWVAKEEAKKPDRRKRCKIILMSGTPEPLKEPLEALQKQLCAESGSDAFRFNTVNYFDRCIHVEPEEVIIDCAEDIAVHEIMGFLAEGQRIIYFASSIRNIAALVKQLNEYGVKDSEIGVSYSNRARDNLFSKELTEKMEQIHKSLIEKEKVPPDVKIFFTTTKNKEGINIRDADIKIMLTESKNRAELVQMAGRVRNGLEKLIILEKHNRSGGNDSLDEWHMYRDSAVCAPLLDAVAAYGEQHSRPSGNDMIRDIEDTFPNIRYDYFQEQFFLFGGKYSEHDQSLMDRWNLHEWKFSWNDVGMSGVEEFQKWFPYSKVDISYPGLHDRIPAPNAIWQEIVERYLSEQNVVGQRLSVEKRDSILTDLNELLQKYNQAPYVKLGPLLRKYEYALETHGKHEKGREWYKIVKAPANEKGGEK